MDKRIDGTKPYYTIQISVQQLPQSSSVSPVQQGNGTFDGKIVNLELDKFTNCIPNVLSSRSIPLNQDSALETLSFLADFMTSRINSDSAIRVDIKPASIQSTSPGDAQLANKLTGSIIGDLAQSDLYAPQDLRQGTPKTPGDFRVEAILTLTRKLSLFQPKTILLQLQPDISSATVVLSIYRGSELLVETPVKRDFPAGQSQFLNQQLAVLFSQAGDAAIVALNSARSSPNQSASSQNDLVHLDESELQLRINDLLCLNPTSTVPCDLKREDALPYLLEMERHQPQDWQPFQREAQTLYDLGQYLQAARSFDRSASRAKGVPSQTIMQLQQGSGDAWYQLGNFAMAAEKYKAALEAYAQMQNPAASGPQDQVARIQIQLARSLSFGGDREGAFGALIDGLKLNTAANALNGELRDLIASMRLEELKRAELRINSTEISALDPNVYATLYCQIANHEINAGSDLSDAEAQLAKAEAIPDEKLDKSARAFILLLRGESYQAKQMWDQAEPKFKTALSLESSPATEHEVGVFYYSWALLGAQSLEQKNTLLGLAANRVLPILQNSDSDSASQLATYAESLYRNANHRTIPSTDATTRSKYMEILLSHPNNFTVENGLMGVCTDFLHDWDCAFAAATMADKPSLDANDIGTELNIAEIYVQSGHYKSAVDKVQTLQINSNPDYATVADFYTLWASLALGDAPGATNAMQAWRKDVVSFRGRPDRDHDFRWRFDGATYLLSHIDALDPHRAETKFSKQDVSSLQSMISTMGDEKVALPDFPQ